MKNCPKLVLVICFLLMTAAIKAQMRFIPVGGANFSTMTLKTPGVSITTELLVGYHFGGLAEIPLSGHLVLQPAIIYSLKGSEYSVHYGEAEYKFSLAPTFIEIPLYAAYRFDLGSAKLFVKAGPYAAYAIGGKQEEKDDERDLGIGEGEDNDMKALDYGLGVGAGIDNNNFLISAQYEFGLANLGPVEFSEMKINVFSVSVSYFFGGN